MRWLRTVLVGFLRTSTAVELVSQVMRPTFWPEVARAMHERTGQAESWLPRPRLRFAALHHARRPRHRPRPVFHRPRHA